MHNTMASGTYRNHSIVTATIFCLRRLCKTGKPAGDGVGGVVITGDVRCIESYVRNFQNILLPDNCAVQPYTASFSNRRGGKVLVYGGQYGVMG